MPEYRSFAEQTLHYLIRDHEGAPTGPVDSPAAWYGPEMAADPGQWLVELPDSAVAEIHDAASELATRGMALAEVTAASFPLPGLASDIAAWRKILGTGLGFVCLRGLPVEHWGPDLSALAYWGLGHHLGIPGAQNPADELLGHVVDYGEEADNPMVRRYRTTGTIDFHCDAADVVGLLCLHPARSGGQSRIASSVTIYNELQRQHPELVERLFTPFHLDRRDEQGEGEDPTVSITPCAYAAGQLRTFWHSEYFRSAARHPEVPDFDTTERQLLDAYDAIACDPGIYLDMWLQPGDVQFISNHTTVHARTGYEDYPEPERRRHLLRLWLSLA